MGLAADAVADDALVLPEQLDPSCPRGGAWELASRMLRQAAYDIRRLERLQRGGALKLRDLADGFSIEAAESALAWVAGSTGEPPGLAWCCGVLGLDERAVRRALVPPGGAGVAAQTTAELGFEAEGATGEELPP